MRSNSIFIDIAEINLLRSDIGYRQILTDRRNQELLYPWFVLHFQWLQGIRSSIAESKKRLRKKKTAKRKLTKLIERTKQHTLAARWAGRGQGPGRLDVNIEKLTLVIRPSTLSNCWRPLCWRAFWSDNFSPLNNLTLKLPVVRIIYIFLLFSFLPFDIPFNLFSSKLFAYF